MKHYAHRGLEKNQDREETIGPWGNLEFSKFIFLNSCIEREREREDRGCREYLMDRDWRLHGPLALIFWLFLAIMNALFNTIITYSRAPSGFCGLVHPLRLHLLTYGLDSIVWTRQYLTCVRIHSYRNTRANLPIRSPHESYHCINRSRINIVT